MENSLLQATSACRAIESQARPGLWRGCVVSQLLLHHDSHGFRQYQQFFSPVSALYIVITTRIAGGLPRYNPNYTRPDLPFALHFVQVTIAM